MFNLPKRVKSTPISVTEVVSQVINLFAKAVIPAPEAT